MSAASERFEKSPLVLTCKNLSVVQESLAAWWAILAHTKMWQTSTEQSEQKTFMMHFLYVRG